MTRADDGEAVAGADRADRFLDRKCGTVRIVGQQHHGGLGARADEPVVVALCGHGRRRSGDRVGGVFGPPPRIRDTNGGTASAVSRRHVLVQSPVDDRGRGSTPGSTTRLRHEVEG